MPTSGAYQFVETDPGADAFPGTICGWIVSTGAGPDYSSFANGVERAASTFGATVQPDGSLDDALTDYWLLSDPGINPITGTFDAGNWVIHGVVRANTNGGAQDGRLRYRVFQGTALGVKTEITAGVQIGSTYTDLGTGANQDSSVTIALGAVTLSAEFIWVQVACERTGAGGMTSADVNFRVGTSGTRVVSPNFTAGGSSPISGSADQVFGGTGDLKGSGALAGPAAMVFGGTPTIRADGALAGSAAMLFGGTPSLTTLPSPIAGAVALVFGGAGDLKATGALAGPAAMLFGGTPTIRADGALAGSSALVFGGTASAVQGDTSGTAALTFGGTGAITATGALAGAAGLAFGQSASLTDSSTPASAPVVEPIGGAGKPKPWRQKWRQELIDALTEMRPEAPPVPIRARKAIQRVLEVLPDDSVEIVRLRSELERLKVSHGPQYLNAMRAELSQQHFDAMQRRAQRRREQDEEDAILALLH